MLCLVGFRGCRGHSSMFSLAPPCAPLKTTLWYTGKTSHTETQTLKLVDGPTDTIEHLGESFNRGATARTSHASKKTVPAATSNLQRGVDDGADSRGARGVLPQS